MFRILVVILAVSVLFVMIMRAMEPRFIFFPLKYPKGEWNFAAKQMQIEDHYFQTSDGLTLHGWMATQKDAIATLLLFHGNAGNLSNRLDLISRLRKNLAVEVFIFDYRGYGRSEGRPSEQGIYEDAKAAYRYLTKQLDKNPGRLIFLGRSLGGAVAIDLAQNADAAGLILESTFSTGKDMARKMFGFIPVWLIMKFKLDSASKIQNVRMPKLFLHGTKDEVVPFELGKKLYDIAPEPKKFVAIQGANHNDIYIAGGAAYYQAMAEFIQKCVNLPTNQVAGGE